MRKLRVSTFSHAADNSAEPYEFLFPELVEQLGKPEISESPPSEEGAQALKLAAGAWSPATFENNVRKNSAVKTVSMLVYDIDGKEKRGIETESLLRKVKDLGLSYAVHCTTRSGFCAPKAKVRLIFPLERDVAVAEYLKLWDKYREVLDLGDDVDTTRRHPGGIFFSPVIFREHEKSYFCRSGTGSFLSVGSGFPSLKDRDESYWIDTVRTAVNKHDALNRAAFAIAQRRARVGKDCSGLEEILFQALRENKVSEDVKDWSAAARTVAKAIEDGVAAAETDPLKTAEKTYVNPALVDTAKRKLSSICAAVTKGGDLKDAAAEIGRFVPHALEEDDVRQALEKAWKACKSSPLSASEIATAIETGLGIGRTRPAGIHDEWKRGLRMNKDGLGFNHQQANVQILVQDHPALFDLLAYNVRTDLTMIQAPPPWRVVRKGETFPQPLTDAEGLFIGPWCTRELDVASISTKHAIEALQDKAHANSIDPLLLYFESLPVAEGSSLLERVLIEAVGAPDTEYSRLISKWWFTSIYARQVKPGQKADYSIILSGFQGQGKSSFFASLFPEDIKDICFTDSIPNWESKECIISLSRFAVVELPELASLSKKSIEAIKAFMTSQGGNERAAFKEVLARYPRRAIFGGSTNEADEFLVDHTGNRRFWPVHAQRIDLEWVKANRDKIWAEARWVYENERCWWPKTADEKALCEAEQKAVEAAEPFQEQLEILLNNPIPGDRFKKKGAGPLNGTPQNGVPVILEEDQEVGKSFQYVLTSQIMTYLGLEEKSTQHKIQVRRAMTRIGWKPSRRQKNGIRLRGWEPQNA